MPRNQRLYRSGHFYEVVFRAKTGLPFATKKIMNAVIESSMARSQRDEKVLLCHYVWMGNHTHLGFIALDAAQAQKYTMEVQKKITESIKRLLGLSHLSLWEGRPHPVEVVDPESAVRAIAYWFANPANANLVETIEEYPGLSSWREFLEAGNDVNRCTARLVPWIKAPFLPKLKSRNPTPKEDEAYTREVTKLCREKESMHDLVLYPNAWMETFGITEPAEVALWNEKIRVAHREMEERARKERKERGGRVLGVKGLLQEPIMKAHKPKEREGRIFVRGSTFEIRKEYIDFYKAACAEYRLLYETRWRHGDLTVEWPPGMSPPPPPIGANRLGGEMSFDNTSKHGGVWAERFAEQAV